MKMSISVSMNGQTTIDVYDVCMAIIKELETVKRLALILDSAEEIGKFGKIGATRRGDSPSGKWKLEIE